MTSEHDLDTDVIVVGCGPVGATLATLLGLRGVRVIVVERDSDVYPLPRAAHIDHQGLRLLQEMGCLDELLPTMLANAGIEFVTADHQVLIRIPANQESVSGLPASMYFHQPRFDRTLRAAAAKLPTVDLRLGADVVGILLGLDKATVTVRTENGAYETLSSLFVVGCDGAWSPTRETVGIRLDSLDFDERWLVLDLILRNGAMPLPNRAVSVCDPARPLTAIPIPENRFRIELQMFPHEDNSAIQEPDVIERLIAGWMPPGSALVERSAVYNFHGLVAEPWRSGRALVAGDAAHQMPPFLGQGMCSGLRDAANLAWKLAHVIRLGAPATLLDTYEMERSPHVRQIVESAVEYGRLTCITDPAEAALRDERWLADGRAATKRLPFRLPALTPGPLVLEGGGELFIQPRDDEGTRLDDVVGQRFLVVATEEETLGASSHWWRDAVGALVTTADSLPGSDALRKWLLLRDGGVAVVRPDRYVMAVGKSLDEITAALPPLLLAAEPDARLVSG
jgi:3-(3-hydroxy-phenyl)propionate hydroxylase